MSRLWDWCAFCGKRIEMGEKCYGLPNGESVCTDCCVAENEGAAVSDGEAEQENTTAEYIEKERVVEWFRPYGHEDDGIPYDVLVADIRDMPAADVAPVVHGRLVHLGGDEWCCSACGFVITTDGSWDKPTKKYCEDCGAKIDEKGDVYD